MTTSFEINSSELVDKNLSSENFRGIVSRAGALKIAFISWQCVAGVVSVLAENDIFLTLGFINFSYFAGSISRAHFYGEFLMCKSITCP